MLFNFNLLSFMFFSQKGLTFHFACVPRTSRLSGREGFQSAPSFFSSEAMRWVV